MRVATVSTTGVGQSNWLPLDAPTSGFGDGIFLDVGAGATVSVEVTPDNVFDPNVVPVAYPVGVAALTGATADVAAQLPYAVRAIRLNQTVGAAPSTMKVVTKGLI